MQKQLAAGVTPAMLNDQRAAFNKDFVNSGLLKDYAVQAVKAKSATQDFTESLVKQDVGFRRAVASRGMFNDVLREQITLQKMLAVQWSKNASGQVSADVIMPKGVDGQVAKLTNSLRENVKAMATNKVGSAEFAQATEIARMRLGLFNEIVASSADNMIKWGKNTQWAGRQLMVGFTVPFAAFAAVAGIAANKVDQEMTRIVKVYDTTANTVVGREKELQQVRGESMTIGTEVAKKYGAALQDTLGVEAELAATGLKGNDLLKSTAEVMRIATLGEMDYQKATQMSIALQTAFHMSTEETTDAMNYMNAVENATSLSLQDFADATPRAAAAMAGLGVNVKEMGVLLVAMKERGVDATEGANALKSGVTRMLNPTNKAVKSFQAMGISLKDISDQSGGNIYKALQMMGAEFKRVGLSATQQQKLIADAFGTYQFNRLNAALTGVTEQTGQTGKAIQLMGQDTQDFADLAQTELDRAANSISGKFKRAVEGLKAELAGIGGPFVEVGTTVITIVSKILKAFNSLPNGVKMFGLIVAGVMALAGPLIMITGLMANLIGQALKMGTSLVMLTTKYRTMTVEQKAQQLLSKQSSLLWSQEASSAQLLNAQLAQLASRFEGLAVAQANANGAGINGFTGPVVAMQGPAAPSLRQTANGRYVRPNGQFASAVEIKAYQAAQNASAAVAQNSAVANKNWGGIAAGAAGLGIAATATASMVAPTNDLVSKWTNIAMIATMVGPLAWKGLSGPAMKGAMSKAGQGIAGVFGKSGKVGGAATATFKNIGLKIAALGPQLLRLAGPIGMIGASALLVFLKIRSEQKKSEENMRKIGESAKDWADILGYVRIETGKIKDINGNQVDTMETLADKLRKANTPLVDQLKLYKSLNQEAKLLDAVTMEGIKVRQSGGTADQAKKAMQVALKAAGFTDQEIEVNLMPKLNIDLNNSKEVVAKQVDLLAKQLDDAFRLKTQQSGWEGFSRFITGSKDKLNTSGKQQAVNVANDFWNTFSQQDAVGRLKYFNDFQKSVTDKQNEIWTGIAQETRDSLQKVGIMNMQELQQMVADSQNMDFYDYTTKYTQEQITELNKMRSDDRTQVKLSAQAEEVLAQQIAKSNGATDDEIKNIHSLNDVRGTNISMARLTVEQAKANYEQTIKESAARGKLSDAEKLNALNQFRLQAGLEAATSLSQGFGTAVAKSTNELDRNSNSLDNNIMTAEEWASAWNDARKDAMSGAQDMALSQADKLWNDQANAEVDAINARGDRRQKALDAQADKADKAFDARQEASEKRFDNQAKALAARWDTAMTNFDANWDARKDREKKYYDDKIDAINNAVKAEEKAEEIRQKIFDAEKQRIERMASIANQRIDFNLALNTGNLDEAAKVFNNMQSTQDSWSIDDASQTSADASSARKDALQKKIDVIDAQKDARLKALDAIEAREKDALEKQKAREEQALADRKTREEKALKEEQDRYNRSLQASRDKATAETKAQVTAHQRQLDDRKAKLELELMAIKASTPRNKAEYDAQIRAIEAAYNKYGVRLQGYGRTWTGYIGSYLTANVAASAAALKDQVKWKVIAADITKQFVDGAFGMSLGDFSKWVTTGQMPATSSFGKGAALSPSDALAQQRAGERASFHTGGIVGKSPGGRTGMSGGRFANEIPINAKKGEAVLNTKATSTLGEDFVHAANAGQLGGGDPSIPKGDNADMALGMTGFMAAGAMAMMRSAMATALGMAAARASANGAGGGSYVAGKAGRYGGGNFSGEQLNNAAIIASVGSQMGMSSRDIEIAIMTAITESSLRNLSGGDRDSVGLFQQRPSQGWGTAAQVHDPQYAARKFYESLSKVQDRGSMSPWIAAQSVQRSAFANGSNYRQYWDEAMAIFTGLRGGGGGPMDLGGIYKNAYGRTTWDGEPINNLTAAQLMVAGRLNGQRYHVIQGSYQPATSYSGTTHTGGGVVDVSPYNDGSVANLQRAGFATWHRGPGAPGKAANYGGHAHAVSLFDKTVAKSAAAQAVQYRNMSGDGLGQKYYGPHAAVINNLLDQLPKLSSGAFTLNDGYAKLHQGEAVLTKPLTEQLKSGVQRIDQGTTNGDVIIDMRGAIISKDVDVEAAVERALEKRDSKRGKKRKIT